jgi:hypothetical protein
MCLLWMQGKTRGDIHSRRFAFLLATPLVFYLGVALLTALSAPRVD